MIEEIIRRVSLADDGWMEQIEASVYIAVFKLKKRILIDKKLKS